MPLVLSCMSPATGIKDISGVVGNESPRQKYMKTEILLADPLIDDMD